MATKQQSGLKVNGRLYTEDELRLSWEEGELVEEITGKALGKLDLESVTAAKALTYVLLRRDDPDLKLEDFQKTKIDDAMSNGA